MKKCSYEEHKSKASKLWHFLAHEDSWASFFVDALLIVLIGKFILYPALGILMGTGLPLVAVVSSSMDHSEMGFEEWWAENEDWYLAHDVTQAEFNGFYLKNGFEKGDVLIIRGAEEIEKGDIVVFSPLSRQRPIIHRVVEIVDETHVGTKGDANSGQISYEKNIHLSQVEGKAILLIPKVGWVKVGFMQLFGMI